jgi:hypothetical protein
MTDACRGWHCTRSVLALHSDTARKLRAVPDSQAVRFAKEAHSCLRLAAHGPTATTRSYKKRPPTIGSGHGKSPDSYAALGALKRRATQAECLRYLRKAELRTAPITLAWLDLAFLGTPNAERGTWNAERGT